MPNTNVVVTGHGFVHVSDDHNDPTPQTVQLAIIDEMLAKAEHTLLYLEKHAPKSRRTKTAPDGLYVNIGDRNMALVQLALLQKLRELRDSIAYNGALS